MERRTRGVLATVPLAVACVALVALVAGPPTVAGAAVAAGGQPAVTAAVAPSLSRLGPGQVLGPGDALVSPDGQGTLIMQADGNLVDYAAVGGANRVLWASGTQGNPGAHAVMQDDGNLVVYSPAGPPLWSSGTAGVPGATAVVQDDGNVVVYGSGGTPLWSSGTAIGFAGPDEGPALAAGQELGPGQYLQSPGGRYRLTVDPRGAPALYQQATNGLWWLMEGSDSLDPAPGVPTFFSCAICTGSATVVPGSYLTLQGDGNLVLYPPGGGAGEWSSGTAGSGGTDLRVQDDGNLVLYDAQGRAVWQTGTYQFRGTVLGGGETLDPGQFVLSPDGAFELVMQADGNLVVYAAGLVGALWSSGTSGDRGAYLAMQDDDNLVVYQGGPTAPGGPGAAVLSSWSSGGHLAGGIPSSVGSPSSVETAVADWSSGTSSPDRGPTMAYAAVATPYSEWLAAAAAQAEQSAQQARSAAAAYEAALSASVPPAVVTANRAQLTSLVASNIFGQNTPAIAATESQYEQMWAQDVTAMYSYAAGASSAAPTPLALL